MVSVARSLLISQDHVDRRCIEPIVKLQVSTKCKHSNKFVASKYATVLIGKINIHLSRDHPVNFVPPKIPPLKIILETFYMMKFTFTE